MAGPGEKDIRASVHILLAATVSAALASTAGAAIAPSATEIDPVRAGDAIPPATVLTPEGEPFDLAAAVREQRTVLIFYRGGW